MVASNVRDLGAHAEVNFTATTAIDLLTIHSNIRQRGRAMVFYLFSDQPGTMDAFYVDQDDNERLLSTTPVLANDLTVINILFRLPRAKLKFTPLAQPGFVNAEAHAYS